VGPGETLLEALSKEVLEETGWTVTGTPARGVFIGLDDPDRG
jgi:8-oxo-dGTP pyrophosphatase MutT (NUDIX family)